MEKTLPNELLFNIATYLNAEDLLSFSRTCRSVHRAAWHALTLQFVLESSQDTWRYQSLNLAEIERRSSQDTAVLAKYRTSGQPALRAWLTASRIFKPSLLFDRLGLDRDALAKYAMADAKALALCSSLDQNIIENRNDVDRELLDQYAKYAKRFIPSLLTMKHPCLHAPGLSVLFWWLATGLIFARNLPQAEFDTEQEIAIAFAACASLASQDTPNVSMRIDRRPTPILKDGFPRLLQNIQQHMNSQPATSDDIPDQKIRWDQALLLVGSASCLLRQAFRDYKVRQMMGEEYYTFVLPFVVESPLDVPECSSYVPLPFEIFEKSGSRSWRRWLEQCSARFLQPENIQDSEWVGIYTVARAMGGTTEFEAPMKDIRFHEVKTNGNAVSLLATGEDYNGQFALEGLTWQDGSMRFRKWYRLNRRTQWEWRCRMTPLGIAGVWGETLRDGRFAVDGAIWLWKQSWTRKNQATTSSADQMSERAGSFSSDASTLVG